MGRPLRLDPEHGMHHVYSRGTRRWTLFIDSLDYSKLMERLARVCARYGIKVYAYCLMGNHFHLVVYCPSGQLAAALRDLKSVYARAHNDRHGFSGPVFEARYGSTLITSYEQLLTVIRYVHRNSLAIDRNMPLEAHRWSSQRFFVENLPTPEWLDTTFPLSFFSDRADYRQFVEKNTASDKIAFRKAAHVALAPPENGHVEPISVAAVLLTIAAVAECSVADIRPRKRNGLIGIAVLVASELGHYSASELADPCGFTSIGGVRNAKVVARRRLRNDAHLRQVHDAVLDRLRAQ